MNTQAAFYVLAAIIVIALVSIAPVSVAWSLTIAFFAWCGGILFDRVVLKAKRDAVITHEYEEPPLY